MLIRLGCSLGSLDEIYDAIVWEFNLKKVNDIGFLVSLIYIIKKMTYYVFNSFVSI